MPKRAQASWGRKCIECTIVKDGANLVYELNGFGPEKDHFETKDFSEVLNDIIETIVEERKKGESFRNISKILRSNFDVEWSHTTIMRKLREWNKTQNIYNEKVNVKADKPLKPEEVRVNVQ